MEHDLKEQLKRTLKGSEVRFVEKPPVSPFNLMPGEYTLLPETSDHLQTWCEVHQLKAEKVCAVLLNHPKIPGSYQYYCMALRPTGVLTSIQLRDVHLDQRSSSLAIISMGTSRDLHGVSLQRKRLMALVQLSLFHCFDMTKLYSGSPLLEEAIPFYRRLSEYGFDLLPENETT